MKTENRDLIYNQDELSEYLSKILNIFSPFHKTIIPSDIDLMMQPMISDQENMILT